MHLSTIRSKPYTIINGKDFAVFRWFAPTSQGPVFLQVAGRTALTRDDLPNDDWVVLHGKSRGHRVATAWRKPWFEYRLDASRRLAFLGGSTEGSFFVALRYLTRRFGIIASDAELAGRSGELAQRGVLPYPHVLSCTSPPGRPPASHCSSRQPCAQPLTSSGSSASRRPAGGGSKKAR